MTRASLPGVAGFLRSRRDAIIDRWERLSKADPSLAVAGKLTHAEFRDNIPAALEALCRILEHPAKDWAAEVKSAVGKHGHHRWKQGFSLNELIHDWGHLNRVLVAIIADYFTSHYPGEAQVEAEALDRFASFMTEALSGSVRRFDELHRAEAAAVSRDLEMTKEQFESVTKARNALLRQAAHDIRGGLSAVAVASHVLKLGMEPESSSTEVLDTLERSVESVRGMLTALLDLSRLEAGEERPVWERFDVAEVCRRLVDEHRLAAARKGLELRSEGESTLHVMGDASMVRRITQNLLVNALEHTVEGQIEITWSLDAERWRLRIADTGPGLQVFLGSAVARELNDPEGEEEKTSGDQRGRAAYHGEGIGLTIVKRLCDLLDASISLESELGRGTVVTVEFPTVPEGCSEGDPRAED